MIMTQQSFLEYEHCNIAQLFVFTPRVPLGSLSFKKSKFGTSVWSAISNKYIYIYINISNKLFYIDYIRKTAQPGVFPTKVNPALNLELLLNYANRGSTEFPYQNLRQIGQGFISYDKTSEQTDRQRLRLYIHLDISSNHKVLYFYTN